MNAAVFRVLKHIRRPPDPLPPQIWASISLITTINHRVLMPRLVQLTGSLPRCQAAALQAHAGATAGARLSPQQAKLAEEANTRLLAMAV